MAEIKYLPEGYLKPECHHNLILNKHGADDSLINMHGIFVNKAIIAQTINNVETRAMDGTSSRNDWLISVIINQ